MGVSCLVQATQAYDKQYSILNLIKFRLPSPLILIKNLKPSRLLRIHIVKTEHIDRLMIQVMHYCKFNRHGVLLTHLEYHFAVGIGYPVEVEGVWPILAVGLVGLTHVVKDSQEVVFDGLVLFEDFKVLAGDGVDDLGVVSESGLFFVDFRAVRDVVLDGFYLVNHLPVVSLKID